MTGEQVSLQTQPIAEDVLDYDALLAATDLVLLDLKSGDPGTYRTPQPCGCSPSRRVASTAAWVRRSRPSLANRLDT